MDISETYVSFADVLDMYDTAEYFVPAFRDFYSLIANYPFRTPFTQLAKLKSWNEKLLSIKAVDSLPEEERKQLKFDAKCAYDDFRRLNE